MLTRNTLNLAKHIVSNSKNILGAPRHAVFAESIRTSLPFMSTGKPSLEDAVVSVGKSSELNQGDINQHELAINQASEIVAKGMENAFNYTRKTVIPFVSAVTDELITRIEQDRPKGFTIIQVDLPEIMGNDLFRDMIRPYVNPTHITDLIKTARNYENVGELVDLLKTGIPSVDANLADIIGRVGAEAVGDIYRAMFCNVRPPNMNTQQARTIHDLISIREGRAYFNLTSYVDLDIAIIAFVLADHFLANPLDGSGLQLNQYRIALNSLRNAIGYTINQLAITHNNLVVSKVVISRFCNSTGIHYKEEDGIIKVVGSVYRSAVESGLTPEMVIGAAIEGKTRQAELIIKEGARFTSYHDKAIREGLEQSQDGRVRFFINNVSSVFQSEVNKLNDDVFPGNYDRIAHVQKIADVNYIREFFEKQYDSENGNLNTLVEYLSAKYIFDFTDCGTIINLINAELDEHEDGITVKEAAYWAYLRYLAQWSIATFDIIKNDANEE